MYVTEPPFGNGTLYDDMVTDKAAHRVSDKFVAAVVRRPGQEIGNACGLWRVNAGSSRGPKTNDRIPAAVPRDIYRSRAVHL